MIRADHKMGRVEKIIEYVYQLSDPDYKPDPDIKNEPKIKFDSNVVFPVLAKLLNGVVISFINISCHRYDIIHNYFQVLQIILAVCQENKEMITLANQKIKDFIQSSKNRHKNYWPHIGEIFAYLFVSDEYSWLDVKYLFWEETLIRMVKWINRKERKLEHFKLSSSKRISWTWKHCSVPCNIATAQFLFYQEEVCSYLVIQ